MLISFTIEELREIESRLPLYFTFTNDKSSDVIFKLMNYGLHRDIQTNMYCIPVIGKRIRNKKVIGYRDTSTNKIYYNSSINIPLCRIKAMALHEVAHMVGYKHHGNRWIDRKFQNKLWYDKTRKLKSVNYQLTIVAEEFFCGYSNYKN